MAEGNRREVMLNAPKSVPSHRSVVTSIADAVLTSLDTREVLLTATELVGQAFRVSRCLAATFSQKAPTACAPVEWSIGLPEPELDAYSVSLASSLQHLVTAERTPVVVDDVRTDERFVSLQEELEKLDVHSLVAVATRFRGVANGSLLLYQSGQPRRWKDWEIQALEEIAYFVGVSIWHTSRANPETAPSVEAKPFLNNAVAETVFDENGVIKSISPGIAAITGFAQ
ncbi:MAG: GAF domain-containing protein, partial [Bdellovibrionales bacterium]|nr:GAF domain-containing protein [Bdellovibrionales bacterium]